MILPLLSTPICIWCEASPGYVSSCPGSVPNIKGPPFNPSGSIGFNFIGVGIKSKPFSLIPLNLLSPGRASFLSIFSGNWVYSSTL